jgi:hypothetical protein
LWLRLRVKIGEIDGEGREKMEWILESQLKVEDWQMASILDLSGPDSR